MTKNHAWRRWTKGHKVLCPICETPYPSLPAAMRCLASHDSGVQDMLTELVAVHESN